MKIKAEDKAKWLEALESGKYKQAMGALYRPETEHASGFCCLGVLQHCTMDGMVETGKLGDAHMYNGLPSIAYAHRHGWKLDDWISYESNTYKAQRVPKRDRENCFKQLAIGADPMLERLIDMNDSGESFNDIAAYIRENVETY